MAFTKSSVAAGLLDKTVAYAVMALQDVSVMLPLVSVQPLPMSSNVAQWSDDTEIASSDVDALTEAGDQATITSLTSVARSATLSDHVIRADIGDLTERGSRGSVIADGGIKLANAVARKNDYDLTALGTGFSQTECGAGTALALSHIFGGLRQLRAANAPFPYNLVMSDLGIWGAKGLYSLLVQPGNTTTSTSVPHSLMGAEGQAMFANGFVDRIGGVNIYFCNEVNDDVSSTDDSASFMFSRGAIGCAIPQEGLMGIEPERNASARSTEIIATGRWGETEIKDAFGVTILHDVS